MSSTLALRMLGRLYVQKSSTGSEPNALFYRLALPRVVKQSPSINKIRRRARHRTAEINFYLPYPTDNLVGVFPKGSQYVTHAGDINHRVLVGGALTIHWRVEYGERQLS